MPRYPTDALTDLLPGTEHHARRRSLRPALARVMELLPEGFEVRIGSDRWDAYEQGDVYTKSEALEIIRAAFEG
jgi:hypothetical protein